MSSYFGLQLIFAPFNFAVLFGSRNSRNKGHPNIKGFAVMSTVSKQTSSSAMAERQRELDQRFLRGQFDAKL